MGQDSAYIHAWLSCASPEDCDAYPGLEPARGESPLLGFEPGFAPPFDSSPASPSESTMALPVHQPPVHDRDTQVVEQPPLALTTQSSSSSLRPRLKRTSSHLSRNALYLPPDSDLDRLTQLLAALPSTPPGPMYSAQESANSSQVWVGTASDAAPAHTPVSPSFPPALVRAPRSHVTVASTSTTASSSLHSPASSFSLINSGQKSDDEAPSSPKVVTHDDPLERSPSWSHSSSDHRNDEIPPPVPPKPAKRESKHLPPVVFPSSPPLSPLAQTLQLPPLDTTLEDTSTNDATIRARSRHPHRSDTLKPKPKKRERFYSFISSRPPSSLISPAPTPTPTTPTPPSALASNFDSPYSTMAPALSTTYLSIDDDEGGQDDPFSSSKFAQSTLPSPLPSASSISSIGSIGALSVDPNPPPPPLSAPASSRKSTFGFGSSQPTSNRLSAALGGLKASPSLPALHSSLAHQHQHPLHPSPLHTSVVSPPSAPEPPSPTHDKKKSRTSIGLVLGLGNRKRALSNVSPMGASVSPSPHRLSFSSARHRRAKTRMELTISYHSDGIYKDENGVELLEEDDKETLLRAWCETLGQIRSIRSQPASNGAELIVVYKKLDGGTSVTSTLQCKQVAIKDVGSVGLSWRSV